MDFHPSWREVVDEFASEQRPGLVRGVLTDLDRLLQADDAAFAPAVRAVGGENIPTSPSDRRAWLAEARERILARLPS
jgi:hypothetical protein